jgi:hypothetical protein
MPHHTPAIPPLAVPRRLRLSVLLAGALAGLLACSTCAAAGDGGPQAAAFDPNQSGLSGSWANAATDGQGFVIDVVPDFFGAGRALIFGGWFSYDTALPGHPRWYTVQGELARQGASAMAVYQTLGGSLASGQPTTTVPVGEFRIQFDGCTQASAQYRFDDGRAGDLPLRRLLGNPTCRADAGTPPAPRSAGWSGAWADTSNSGQGLVLEFDPDRELMFGAWYTFAGDANTDAGAAAQQWYTLQATAPQGSADFGDIGLYATSGGSFDRHAPTTTVRVGTTRLTLHDCSHATLAWSFESGPNAGRSGTLELTRLTTPPAGCTVPQPAAGSAEGYWTAATAVGEVRIIIPGNGEIYVVDRQGGADARLVHGVLADNAGTLAAPDGRGFPVSSTPGEWPERRAIVDMSGTYAPRQWLRLIMREGGRVRTLEATWDDAYDRPASAAAAAGSYLGIAGIQDGALDTQFAIAADGSLSGRNIMCRLSGTLVPRGSTNLFDWELRGESPGCIFGAGPHHGIAWYEPADRSFHSYVSWLGGGNLQYTNGHRQ